MLRLLLLAGCGLVMICSRFAQAHGTPIAVTAAGGDLVADGGVADSAGFAPQIFVEVDENGDSSGSLTLPNVGPVVLWQTPGFNIVGLNDSASLSIDVLVRPVKDSSPLEERMVWYWDPQVEEVASSVADIHLLGTGARYVTLLSDDSTAPAPFLLAASLTGQQNTHNHGLLSYGLDNDSPRPAGAYGFFAQLTSDQYGASNPLLIVLNLGVEYEQMIEAALAINAAAVEPESLPGDFNHDGTVDAADYVVWRKPVPTEGDYSTWLNNFGRSVNGDGASVELATNAPEPMALLPLACELGFLAMLRNDRRIPSQRSRRSRS